MTRFESLSAVAFLVALALFLTWPQALHLGDALVQHNDPYFSTWRLAWMAHALRVAPRHLFDANIFYPEPRTLAYSDATFFEGAIAAPFLWAGARPILVYNVMLLAGIAASGIGMLVLVQHLTGNSRAALVGAAVFTLLPYRLEHVMHLELQWAMWIPLTWWALHRAFEARSLRHGAFVGVLIWLQLLSCVYYGIFLVLALPVLAAALLLADRRGASKKVAVGIVAAAVAIPLMILYARPYLHNTQTLGERPVDEVARFSATALSFASAPVSSAFWGTTADWFTGNELHLFPGLVSVALALVAIASRRRRLVAVYGALALFAVVMSFGEHLPVYAWLREHLFVLRGIRAVARFAIVAFAALAVLAALGYERLEAWAGTERGRSLAMMACLVALGLEATPAPLRLEAAGGRTPDIYTMVRMLPAAPVVEFPTADPAALPGYDAVFMLESTTHWRPLVNGYSGYVSRAYVHRLEQLEGFPDRESVACLTRLGVRYAIVHEAMYQEKELPPLLLAIARTSALIPIGRYRDAVGWAQLFEIRGALRR